MYAVITSPKFYTTIDNLIKSLENEIIFKVVDDAINISDVIAEIIKKKIPINKMIIDISAISDDDIIIVSELIKYRISNDKVQIIIIAPNILQGNKLISELVSKVRINDIIAIREDEEITEKLIQAIEAPATYIQASKWILNKEVDSVTQNTKIEREKEVVTILKDRIIGTVVIAVTGTMHRVGTTHTCISIATFLKNNGYNVAVVELNNTNIFNSIKNAYTDTIINKDNFILNEITYYPNFENLNLINVLNKDFNYVILDLGVYSENDLIEFKRANFKIVVSGVKDWEVINLENFLKTTDNINKNTYLFTFSNDDNYKFIKQNMDELTCFKAPINLEPFICDKDINILYMNILNSVLPETIENNNKKENPIKKLLSKRFQK